MSVNLCIDYGNSSVKTAIFDNDKIVAQHTFPGADATHFLHNIIEEHKPQKAILCSVVDSTGDIEILLKEKVKSSIKLDSRTALPVMNAYTSKESLGSDRVALAAGAYMLQPGKNILVISAGTCITYNFIQKNKTFRGGAISPGLKMRLQAMHQFTDKLPQVPLEGELLLLGYDTDTCMRSGAVYGMAAEIDGMVRDFENEYPDFNAILTGGDAPFFADKLKSKIFAEPELLLKGLNLILNHNVPIPR